MPFAVLTPLSASTHSTMPSSLASTPLSPPSSSSQTSARLNLSGSGPSASRAARDSIISSSAKGWSPLQIHKRDSITSPRSPRNNNSTSPSSEAASETVDLSLSPGGPRRTSNSFKHVAKNSLVSSSPFKNSSTVQGQQAAGTYDERKAAPDVIHERQAAPRSRALGQAPAAAMGSASTPKAAVGLGITAAARPRSSSNNASSSASGGRKVSNERKITYESSGGGERRVSSEQKVSGSGAAAKENDSPDVRSSGSAKKLPRQSGGLVGLKQGGLVTRSPFKRVPSGGNDNSHYASSPSAATTTTTASPKTVLPNVYDSPSPSPRRVSPAARRVSGGNRRVSPSPSKLGGTSSTGAARASLSPTPSPPRLSYVKALPAGPSPLSGSPAVALAHQRYTAEIPTPTPGRTPTKTKSALTPSRRLCGPRGLMADLLDSPSKANKTVTFQAVPDVKEFEQFSVEGSMDGSFEVDDEDDGEWEDTADSTGPFGANRGAMLDMQSHPIEQQEEEARTLELAISDLSIGRSSFEAPPSALRSNETTPDLSEDMHHASHHESSTADFVNTLIEEGLFSPPQLATPAIPDHLAFMSGDNGAASNDPPRIPSPSTLSSIQFTPAFESENKFEAPHSPHKSALGTMPPQRSVVPPPQPIPLPRDGDHHMLMNAHANQPALPKKHDAPPTPPGPHAKQLGAMHDPFITIQTATNIISPPRQRTEDGIPLGRTSHVERMHAARALATQSIGLGMPRSAAGIAAPSSGAAAATVDDQMSESGSEGDSREIVLDPRDLYDDPFSAPPIDAVTPNNNKRGLPKPPSAAAATPAANAKKPEQRLDKKASKLDFGFSLPFIGQVSPFFTGTPKVGGEAAHVPTPSQPGGNSTKSAAGPSGKDDDGRPLTPPPAVKSDQRDDSPHRIPSFEFEQISLSSDHLVRKATVTKNPISPVKLTTTTTTVAATTTSSSVPLSKELGAATAGSGGNDSTTTRVRQRISREMIRETINARIADGSISRQGARAAGGGSRPLSGVEMNAAASSSSEPSATSTKYTTSVEEPKLMFANDAMVSPRKRFSGFAAGPAAPAAHSKSLPQPPSTAPAANAQPMVKAHTSEGLHEAERLGQGSRPRSQTIAPRPVSELLHTDSALDRIALFGGNEQPLSAAALPPRGDSRVPAAATAAADVRPTSILLQPGSHPPAARSADGKLAPNTYDIALDEVSPGSRPVPQLPDAVHPTSASSSSARQAQQPTDIAARRKEQMKDSIPAAAPGGRVVSGAESLASQDSRRGGRRSLSMSEMPMDSRRKPRLTLGLGEEDQSVLEAFREEASIIGSDKAYRVRERPTVKASMDQIRHNRAGDIDEGKAWRSVRRPSDINEHAAQLRALRNREAAAAKAAGTIFVKVLGIEGLTIPVPDQTTYFCVTLDNGIDYIRTPYTVLGEGARVNQEFSLVEHPNFEFSLSLDVRKDPHILKAMHELERAEARPPSYMSSGRPPTTHSHRSSATSQTTLVPPASPEKRTSSAIKSFFSSPRKMKMSTRPAPEVPPSSSTSVRKASTSTTRSSSTRVDSPAAPAYHAGAAAAAGPDTIAKYLATPSSATIAKTHIAFKPIAKNCEARILEIRYPMFAMFKGEPDRPVPGQPLPPVPNQPRKQVAKITLQMLRLPPLPGLRPDELPQCIDDCLRGIRHHAWHECEYHEGILTQDGGDCTHPKRRMFKLIGGNLVAHNEVTKKQVSTIDLRKATRVIDLDEPASASTPANRMSRILVEEEEGWTVRPNSFRVEFGERQGAAVTPAITFSADKAADKKIWLETLSALIGRIPSNPLWAEVLAEKMREKELRERQRSVSKASLSAAQAAAAAPAGGGQAASRDRERSAPGGTRRASQARRASGARQVSKAMDPARARGASQGPHN